MSVHAVVLADCLRNMAPPERVLRMSAVGDTAFLYIEKYDETSKGSTTEVVAQIAVSLPAIREALQLMRHDIEREDTRPTETEHGDMGARLTGNRMSVLPL